MRSRRPSRHSGLRGTGRRRPLRRCRRRQSSIHSPGFGRGFLLRRSFRGSFSFRSPVVARYDALVDEARTLHLHATRASSASGNLSPPFGHQIMDRLEIGPMASPDELRGAISAIPPPITAAPPPVHESLSPAGFEQPRLAAVVGLICFAITASLCLVAFLSYRRHAERVLEANVMMAKGMGAAGGIAFFPALLGDAQAAKQARFAL